MSNLEGVAAERLSFLAVVLVVGQGFYLVQILQYPVVLERWNSGFYLELELELVLALPPLPRFVVLLAVLMAELEVELKLDLLWALGVLEILLPPSHLAGEWWHTLG